MGDVFPSKILSYVILEVCDSQIIKIMRNKISLADFTLRNQFHHPGPRIEREVSRKYGQKDCEVAFLAAPYHDRTLFCILEPGKRFRIELCRPPCFAIYNKKRRETLIGIPRTQR